MGLKSHDTIFYMGGVCVLQCYLYGVACTHDVLLYRCGSISSSIHMNQITTQTFQGTRAQMNQKASNFVDRKQKNYYAQMISFHAINYAIVSSVRKLSMLMNYQYGMRHQGPDSFKGTFNPKELIISRVLNNHHPENSIIITKPGEIHYISRNRHTCYYTNEQSLSHKHRRQRIVEAKVLSKVKVCGKYNIQLEDQLMANNLRSLQFF